MARRVTGQDIELELAKRRSSLSVIDRMLAPLSGPMRAFVQDKSRKRAAQCTRRAGKSTTAALAGIIECLEQPGIKVAIVGKTMESVRNIFWKPILKRFDREFRLGCKFNGSLLEMTFPNGSEIMLAATDANEDQKLKIFGQAFRLVVIDEAEAFITDVRELVMDVLGPAMVDYNGAMVMCGMPCNRTYGFYYDVVTNQRDEAGLPKYPGWSIHRWSALDNPFIEKNWRDHIEELKRENPRITENPGFRQMYLNEWVIDNEKRVYRSGPSNVLPQPGFSVIRIDELHRRAPWRFVLGVDLGFDDDTAFAVQAWHPHDRTLYVIHAEKQAGLDITATAQRIKALREQFGIEDVTVDGSNKQAVQEMVRRHGLRLQPADKRGKAEFIDILNAELAAGQVLVDPGCTGLLDEWAKLVWDESELRKGRRVEDGKCANHLSDACLYAWRMTRSYWATEAPKDPLGRGPQLRQIEEQQRRRLGAEEATPEFDETVPELDGSDPWQQSW